MADGNGALAGRLLRLALLGLHAATEQNGRAQHVHGPSTQAADRSSHEPVFHTMTESGPAAAAGAAGVGR